MNSMKLYDLCEQVMIGAVDNRIIGVQDAQEIVGLCWNKLECSPEMDTLEAQMIALIEDLSLLPIEPHHITMLGRGLERLI